MYLYIANILYSTVIHWIRPRSLPRRSVQICKKPWADT